MRNQKSAIQNLNIGSGRKPLRAMHARLYKLERILMQQVDLKSALNFNDFS